MMGQEFVPRYSSRDARYVVGGATTQKDSAQSLNWFTGEADVSPAGNAQRNVNEKPYSWRNKVYRLTERNVVYAATAPECAHLTLFQLRESS